MQKSTAIFPPQNLRHMNRGYPAILRLAVLAALLFNMVYGYVSNGITSYEGVTQDIRPSFFRLDGTNGVQVQIDSRQGGNIDYLIKFWFRSQRQQGQLGQQSETLFQVLNTFQCGFQYQNILVCGPISSSNGITLATNGLASTTWIHLAVAGSQKAGFSYIRLDYADQVFSTANTSYVPLAYNSSPWYVNLGINGSLQAGFLGDIREFFIAQQYVAPSSIPFIKNQIMTWDPSQMGYFRLTNSNIQDSFRDYSGHLLYSNSSSQPIMMQENRPDDMCYPFLTYSQIAQLNIGAEDGSVSTISLDSRYKREESAYYYTFSMWLQTLPGFSTTASPSSGRNSAYFFSLDQSFNLWFTDDQHFAIYFLGNPSYTEVYSQAIYVPLNQWVNIQIQIDQVNGYVINVYDLQRRQISSFSSSQYLPKQIPSGNVILANNFKGYIKQIILYQTKMNLPISGASGASTTITDDNLLLYYNFDSANFIGRTLQSLAVSSSGLGRGPQVYIASVVSFDYKIWDDSSTFSSPSSVGTLQQSTSLFDGLACKDSNLTFMLNSAQSYISTNTIILANATTQATVELWFKRSAQLTQTNYLLSMYAVAQQGQYFAIYQDGSNSNLTCAPFPGGNSSVYQPRLRFAAANSSNITSWQHVTCSFKQSGQIQGQYDNTLGYSVIYTTDISNTTTLMPAGQYKINIGNNYNGTLGSVNTFYKEVRFWTSVRSPSAINRYLYTQFDPSRDPSLLAYFRLAGGNPYIQNYPGLDSGAACSTSGLSIQSENTLTVCPLYTYANLYGSGCYQNFFYKQYVHVFAVPIAQAPYIQYQLTSQYSDTVRSYSSETILYIWSTTHQPTQQNIVNSQQNNQTLVIPVGPNGLAIDFPYTFTAASTNTNTTFISAATQTLMVQQCRWLADNATQLTSNDIVTTNLRGAADLTFTFLVNNVSNETCSLTTAYLYLQTTAQLLVTPSQLNITNIYQQFTLVHLAQGFQITVPASEQYKFPMDSFVNLVFTVSWSNDPNGGPAQALSQLNIAYRVKFATNVQPVIVANTQLLLVSQQLSLDGSQSYITSISDPILNKLGLNYQWQCPTIFQSLCQNQTTLSALNLPYSYFLASGANFSTNYTFTLAVSRSAADSDASGGTSVNITIVWVNIVIPSYTIILNGGQNRVLATASNVFMMSLSNYAPNDPHLVYKWRFIPDIQVPSLITLSPDNSTLTMLPYGFAFNTSYLLNVSVSYIGYPTSEVVHQYGFTTRTPPVPGSLVLSGTNGTALQTTFTVSIANWTSYYPPLQYKLFGMSSPQSAQFALTSNWISGSSNFTTLLPPLSSIIVQVTDASLEVANLAQNVTIVGDPFTNWTTSIQNIVNMSGSDIQLKYDTLSFLVIEMNGFVDSGVPNSVNIQDRATIFGLLQQDTAGLTAGSSSPSTVTLIEEAAKVTNLLSAEPTLLNGTLANQSLSLLQLIALPSSSYQTALQSQAFLGDYASTLSNLMVYAQKGISQTTQTSQRRMLQQSSNSSTSNSTNNNSSSNSTNSTNGSNGTNGTNLTTNGTTNATTNSSSQTVTTSTTANVQALRSLVQSLIQYKQALADQLCTQQTVYNVQQKVETPSYYTIIEKVPFNQPAATETMASDVGNSSATFSVADLINATTQANSSLQDICIQTTFYKINPLMGYNYTNQSISSQANFVQINTLSSGFKLLEAPLVNQINTTFQIAFAYNFSDPTLNFRNNQTICMVYNYQSANYSLTPWAAGSCTTKYDMTYQQVLCTCKSMSADYYGLVTDYSRLWVRDIVPSGPLPSFFAQFVNTGLAVIIFLLFFALVMPIVALCLDKKDYTDLKRDTNHISEDFMKQVAIARQQPLEEVLYRKKALSEYMDMERASFCYIQGVFVRNLHPFTSIFSRFDISVKRMIRFMMVLYQISIIAIISAIVFSPHYRLSEAGDPERAKMIDSTDLRAALICGAVLSILTLPWPSWLSCCLKTKLVRETKLQENLATSKQNKASAADVQFSDIKKRSEFSHRSQEDDDEHGKVYTSQRAQTVGEDAQLKGMNGPSQVKIEVGVDEPVAAVDKCIPCKVFLILLSYALCVIAVIVVGVICSKVPKSQVISIVISFYLATLGGWFILNILRIFFVALIAPAVVVSEDENDGQSTCFSRTFSFLLVNHEAKEMIRDMQAVHEIVDDEQSSPDRKVRENNRNDQSSNTQDKLKEINSPSAIEDKSQVGQNPVQVVAKKAQVQQMQGKKDNARSSRYLEENSKKKNNNKKGPVEESDDESQ